MRKFIRKIKYYFSKKKDIIYKYPKSFIYINNEYLPKDILDFTGIMYNVGYNEKYSTFMVVLSELETNLEV